MNVTKHEEIDILDFLEDCDMELPEPANPIFETSIDVSISGKYRPAVLFPNDKAQPAEYPEAEATIDGDDLAMMVLSFYGAQVRLNADEAIAFLRIAKRKCACIVDAAETWAMEQDQEPPEPPERDDWREDADHWQHN